MAVLKLPGSITITLTPNGSSSRRRLSEIASRPNLDAAYGPRNGSALRPATELMLTMRPRDALRSGRNACVTATAATRLTSRTRLSSSSGNSSSGPAAGIPALFTSPASGAPARARSTCSRARAMLAVSVTSIRTAVTPARSSAASSSARRTVPNTRKPRPATCRTMAAPKPVEAPVTTTPPLTRAIYDLRASVAVRSQLDNGRRSILGALVRFDDQRPGPLRGPGTLQGVDALSRRPGEVQFERPPLPVHHALGGAGHDEPHCRAMVERVHQQERVACRLVVRVGRQLDRDPGRTLQSEGRGSDDRARERGEGEATNPRLHDNLRIGVVGEMPPSAGAFERLLRDPVDAAPGEEVQLSTRVFAE